MSEMGFVERYRPELQAACLGYGYGIINCTNCFLWIKGVTERDWLLIAILFLSAIPITTCFGAMSEFVDLLGKDDGVRQARYQNIFKVAVWIGFLEFILLFKFFLVG